MWRRLSNWMWQHKILTAVAFGGFVVGVYFLGTGWWKARLVSQELARLHAAGIPTNAQELNEFVAIPPGEANATAAWMKPIMMVNGGAIGRPPYGFAVLDKSGHYPPRTDEEWPDLRRAEQYIVKHQALFDAIDRAVATPGTCCFVADYTGDDIMLPHVDALRPISKQLAMRTFVRVHQGRLEEAINGLEAMVESAESMKSEPIMVTQSVRSSLASDAVLVLEQVLASNRYASDDLARLQASIDQIEFLPGIRRAVAGQRVVGVEYLTSSSTAIVRRALLGDHPLKLLNAMRQLDEGIDGSWHGVMESSDNSGPRGWDSTKKKLPWGAQVYAGPTAFAEAWASRLTLWAGHAARLRAAATGIAVVRYYDQHNRWPDSLDDLVPEYQKQVPSDPFTGEPLKFLRVGNEIRVYSVGPNRTDDGGSEVPEVDEQGNKNYKGNPDVVFRIRADASGPQNDPASAGPNR